MCSSFSTLIKNARINSTLSLIAVLVITLVVNCLITNLGGAKLTLKNQVFLPKILNLLTFKGFELLTHYFINQYLCLKYPHFLNQFITAYPL